MQLLRDGVLFGTLSGYQYETPWAIAHITPVDAEAWARLCRASKVDALDPKELPDDELEYDRFLASHGVTQEDLKTLGSGGWSIVNPSSTPRDARGPIDIYECNDEGWVRWRWR